LQVSELVTYPDKELSKFVSERFQLELVPEGERLSLMNQAHVNGHFGADHVFRSIWLSGKYWPAMKRDCIHHVSTCLPCLRFNIGKRGYHPQRIVSAKYPFEHIAVDTITGFPTSPRGFNCILVVTDICTRFTVLFAQIRHTARVTARSLWSLVCTFPLPKIIQSDNGPEFVNHVIKAFANLLGVDHRLVAPYNPRANGSAENRVGVAQSVLRKVTNGDMSNWDYSLPAVQLAMNSKINPSTKSSPTSLVFNMPTQYFADYRTSNSFLSSEESLLSRAADLHSLVFPEISTNFNSNRSARTSRVNERKIVVPPLPVGAKVMLKDPRRGTKHQPYWYGPLTVVAQSRGGTYTLQNPDRSLVSRPVPRDQLKLISSDVPVDDIFFVERILDHRGTGNNLQYLVKWLNYPTADNTWEPASGFIETKCIDNYWTTRSSPDAPIAPIASDADSDSDDFECVSAHVWQPFPPEQVNSSDEKNSHASSRLPSMQRNSSDEKKSLERSVIDNMPLTSSRGRVRRPSQFLSW